jgi:hypothetical protein
MPLFAVATFLVTALSLVGTAQAATIVKANNTTSLSAGTSWVGGIAPGILDVAQWDTTATGSNATTLGAGFYLGEISILNPGGPVTVNADGNTLNLYGINRRNACPAQDGERPVDSQRRRRLHGRHDGRRRHAMCDELRRIGTRNEFDRGQWWEVHVRFFRGRRANGRDVIV